jgi:hypothetical protein
VTASKLLLGKRRMDFGGLLIIREGMDGWFRWEGGKVEMEMVRIGIACI